MSDIHDDDGGYKVGYGRPPKHSQFKKGQSGNPAGRTKKPTDLDRIKQMASETVKVTVGGSKQEMSAREALLRSCREKALRGSIRDARQYIALLKDMGIEVISVDDLRYLDGTVQEEGARQFEKLRQELFAIDPFHELMAPYLKRQAKLLLEDPYVIELQITFWLSFLDDAKDQEDLDYRLKALKEGKHNDMVSPKLVKQITRRHQERGSKPFNDTN